MLSLSQSYRIEANSSCPALSRISTKTESSHHTKYVGILTSIPYGQYHQIDLRELGEDVVASSLSVLPPVALVQDAIRCPNKSERMLRSKKWSTSRQRSNLESDLRDHSNCDRAKQRWTQSIPITRITIK